MSQKNNNTSSGKNIMVNGTLLSTRDPLYYEKLLMQKPNDPYVLFALGFKYECQAEDIKETDETVHKRKLKQSLHYFQLAQENGYIEAKEDIERIKASLRKHMIPIKRPKRKNSILEKVALLIIVILAVALLFISYIGFERMVSAAHTEQVSYDKQEPQFTASNRYLLHIYEFDEHDSLTEMKKKMLTELNIIRKSEDSTFLELLAIQSSNENNKEVFSLFSLPDKEKPLIIKKDTPLKLSDASKDSLSLTMVRSALYHFVVENGVFPLSLEQMNKEFPHNYLSDIPKDSHHNLNNTHSEFDNTGGWVYSPPQSFVLSEITPSKLREVIGKTLKPNFAHTCTKSCDFLPLEVHIDKSLYSLEVKSGNVTFVRFDIGLGKDDSTPEGLFQIRKRIAFPNHHTPFSTMPFGTRGLELSNAKYAIHGTSEEESIGGNMSQGCIRLRNVDVEQLFAMIPLHTTVLIEKNIHKVKEKTPITPLSLTFESSSSFTDSNSTSTKKLNHSPTDMKNNPNSNESTPAGCDGRKCKEASLSDETDEKTVYHWSD